MRLGRPEALAPILLSDCTVCGEAARCKHLDSVYRVGPRQHIGRGEVMVDSDVELVSVGSSRGCVVEGSCPCIGIRIKRQKECRLRGYSLRRDNIARER